MSSSGATNEKEISSLSRQHTPGGHVDDRSQPPLPVVHRSFANPAPLGLIAFATSMATPLAIRSGLFGC